MILFINTNSKEEIKFIATDNDGNILGIEKKVIEQKESQKILEFLSDFLSTLNPQLSTLNSLVICNGPGINMNFRIGIIISNAIAYIKKIPIVGILSTEFSSDEEFIKIGIEKIKNKQYSSIVSPEYSVKNS